MRHAYNEDTNFREDMPIGEFIRKKRRLMGYNQMDFADMLGVNQGTLSRWEMGDRTPTFDLAKDIVEYLGGEILIVNKKQEEKYGC